MEAETAKKRIALLAAAIIAATLAGGAWAITLSSNYIDSGITGAYIDSSGSVVEGFFPYSKEDVLEEFGESPSIYDMALNDKGELVTNFCPVICSKKTPKKFVIKPDPESAQLPDTLLSGGTLRAYFVIEMEWSPWAVIIVASEIIPSSAVTSSSITIALPDSVTADTFWRASYTSPSIWVVKSNTGTSMASPVISKENYKAQTSVGVTGVTVKPENGRSVRMLTAAGASAVSGVAGGIEKLSLLTSFTANVSHDEAAGGDITLTVTLGDAVTVPEGMTRYALVKSKTEARYTAFPAEYDAASRTLRFTVVGFEKFFTDGDVIVAAVKTKGDAASGGSSSGCSAAGLGLLPLLGLAVLHLAPRKRR